MPERDPQTIVLSRQSILLVTAVGVGLLTLCYVLGVQVGKQSAAIRQSAARGAGEELEALPAPIQEQLEALESGELVKTPRVTPKAGTTRAEPVKKDPPAKPETKPEVKPETKPEAPKDEGQWTVQLVSTSDPAEADRIAAKAKAAGFAATTVKDKNLFKVRLIKPGPRSDTEAIEAKLKAKGFKTFLVKVG